MKVVLRSQKMPKSRIVDGVVYGDGKSARPPSWALRSGAGTPIRRGRNSIPVMF
jgi:hypothetical protein